MQIKTRVEAAAAGERRYFTGEPCKKGHVAERYTSTGGCIRCLRPVIASPGGRPTYIEILLPPDLIPVMAPADYVSLKAYLEGPCVEAWHKAKSK